MSLQYLSGDVLGASRKRQAKKAAKKAKKETKTATKAGKKDTRKAKRVEKKAAGGRGLVKKKVAKIGLAPARAAFLTAVNLNALKVATKLARMYNKPNGKAALQKFWLKFGGDFEKLKQGISKGSKQQINADSVGVAVEVLLATAAPLLIALAPLLKEFKAGGDTDEMNEFDLGVKEAKEELKNNDDFEKTDGKLPPNKKVGVIKDEGGDEDNNPKEGNSFSLLGVLFKTPLLIAILGYNNLFFSIINIYCVVGFLLFGFYMFNWLGLKRFVSWYFELPINFFTSIIFKIKSAWQRKQLNQL